jgi:hypothetical protein
MTTPTKWTDMLQADLNFAKERIMEDGFCRLTIVLHGPKTVAVVPMSGRSKRQFYTLGALVGISINAHAAAVFSEAWGAPDSKGGVVPSEHPERWEMVFATLCYRDEETGEPQWIGVNAKILRGADGNASGFEEDEEADHVVPMSNLTALLPEERPSEEMQRGALRALRVLEKLGVVSQEIVDIAASAVH